MKSKKLKNDVNIQINIWTPAATEDDFKTQLTTENIQKLRREGKIVDFETLSDEDKTYIRKRAAVAFMDEMMWQTQRMVRVTKAHWEDGAS